MKFQPALLLVSASPLSPVRSLCWLILLLFDTPARSPLKPLLSYGHKGFATHPSRPVAPCPSLLALESIILTVVAISPLGRNLRSETELPRLLASIGNRSRIEGEEHMLIFGCCALSYLHPPLTLCSCAGHPLPARNAINYQLPSIPLLSKYYFLHINNLFNRLKPSLLQTSTTGI